MDEDQAPPSALRPSSGTPDAPPWSFARKAYTISTGLFGAWLMTKSLSLDVERMRIVMDAGSSVLMASLLFYIGGASGERIGLYLARRNQS